jgi:hypothetical protein
MIRKTHEKQTHASQQGGNKAAVEYPRVADAGGRKPAWSEKPHGDNTRLVAPHGK